MGKTREDLLQDLTRNKKNRKLSEVEAVLRAFGGVGRAATKEASVWSLGMETLTLPSPHGGDKVLKIPYVVRALRMVQMARDSEKSGSGSDEEDP